MSPAIDATISMIWVSIGSCDLPMYTCFIQNKCQGEVYMKYLHNTIKSVLKRSVFLSGYCSYSAHPF